MSEWCSFSTAPALRTAIEDSDITGVNEALDDNASANTCMPYALHTTNPDGTTKYVEYKNVPVLAVAAHKGDADIVSALLEAGADPKKKGDFRSTPLNLASVIGHCEIVENLLDNNADVNAKDTISGQMPIHKAARYGHLEIAKLLYKSGSRLNVKDKSGNTPLHLAASGGYDEITEWLTQQDDVDITMTNKDGMTAADKAESEGHRELSESLATCTPELTHDFAQMKIQDRQKNMNNNPPQRPLNRRYSSDLNLAIPRNVPKTPKQRFGSAAQSVKKTAGSSAAPIQEEMDKNKLLIKAVNGGDIDTLMTLVDCVAALDLQWVTMAQKIAQKKDDITVTTLLDNIAKKVKENKDPDSTTTGTPV